VNATENQRLLVKVARLYYEQDLTQNEIGERLRLSRQKVQRLLRQAQEEGVVQINIRPVMGTYPELEKALEQSFRLTEAVIVETSAFDNQPTVAREVGAGAARYLNRIIQPDDRIVISWGGSLLGMVNALQSSTGGTNYPGVSVILGLGGLGDPNNEVHAADLTRRLAWILGGQAVLLHTPAVAGTREARDAFYADPFVRQTLEMARSAHLAIMGIGAPRQDSILMQQGKIVSWPELQALQQRGAVGDINLRYFDAAGQPISSDLDDRTIGLSLAELKEIPQVIGVAGGAAKIQAIAGALHGRLVDVLVTDHRTAKLILETQKP
jgi:DNA-binding transcriptional regulator LsrR (DeoR family)